MRLSLLDWHVQTDMCSSSFLLSSYTVVYNIEVRNSERISLGHGTCVVLLKPKHRSWRSKGCYPPSPARFYFVVFVVVFLVLPILHFGRWLVRGTFAVCSSYVRPVNRNKWRRAIWNAHMTYKRIRLMPYFLPCGVHQFSLLCLYFIGNFRPKNFWFRHACVVS